MRLRRNAKIVATLGPASSSPEMINALFADGVDIFRLNFSHGTHEEHAVRLEAIRRLERKLGRPIGIVADLQGPKLRVGTFPGGPVRLEAGLRFRLELKRKTGDAAGARLPHPELRTA